MCSLTVHVRACARVCIHACVCMRVHVCSFMRACVYVKCGSSEEWGSEQSRVVSTFKGATVSGHPVRVRQTPLVPLSRNPMEL